MKVRVRVLAALVLLLALFATGLYAVASFVFSDSICGGNEERVVAMQALPDDRLQSLFHYAQSLHKNRSSYGTEFIDFSNSNVPKELVDLKPKSLRYFGDTLAIHISGCFDDKVYLFVEGANEEDGDGQIVVTLGEWKGSEILWKQ